MLKIILVMGAPASGKSTWAKQEVSKEPLNWVRISNDDLRNSFNGYVFSADYEKLITDTRNFLLREALKRDKNIIIDNVNSNSRHWETACKLAGEANKDVMVMTKHFYEELEVLLERNAKREGTARVPDDAIKRFFKELGGKQFAFAREKKEIFKKRDYCLDATFTSMVQDETKPKAIMSDLDGTYALLNGRNPYDPSNCDTNDLPNFPVIETIKLYHKAGHKVIFCSGRDDQYEPQTRRFIEKYFDGEYLLFMRKMGDSRKDAIIKEEIFDANIRAKYWVQFVLDDRDQVVSKWREMGLTCFQVAPGNF